ncbi:MAG: FecR domain-containing protein [Rhodocyclales bacterium]|nr:FecR domain-containing protein [Rhodocyclales bacterium]
MKTSKASAVPAFFAALAMFLALPAFAQGADEVPPDMVAPPRLSVAEGDVQFWRPGADGWEPAQINAALAEGDSINAGGDATVELQIGPRDYVRMMANTQLTLETHDAGMMHFRLGSGAASFDLRGGRSGQLVRIDTDDANIVVGGRGYYRISTREGETRLIVRNQGRATLTFADGRSRSIGAGEEIVVQAGGASIDSHGAPPQDAWDRWNDARSDYYAAAASNRYVPDDVYGAADLDQHGSWREDTTYGWIWMPAVASGWVPYSTGSWRWDPFYGWTWVDVAPWGWTTSHYGRWVNLGGAWCWAPGPRRARVVYAPALVAFFHGPVGMSWVALGWGEPIVPWWGRPGFRGSAWWGGWGGPRVAYHHERHSYRNRSISTAVITVREHEFGHRRIHGSSLPLAPGVELRPVRGDHPVRFAAEREHRRDTTPPRPRLEPMHRQERIGEPRELRQPRDAAPQGRTAPDAEQRAPRQPAIIAPQRPEAGRWEPQRDSPRVEQRERRQFEPRREERRAEPAVQPRVIAPVAPAPAAPTVAAPVIQPRVIAPAPEVRREPPMQREVQREMQRERRHEERVIQRESPRIQPQRMEPPRVEMRRPEMPRVEMRRAEMPRPQVQAPSAPEVQRRAAEREQGGHRERGRPRGPGERD